jgi:hypothetical protein
MDQNAVASYLADYIRDDKIRLGDMEALFLFELGTTNMGSTAADFQDLVVLVSLMKRYSGDAVPESSGQLLKVKEAIFCPPENEGEILEILEQILAD